MPYRTIQHYIRSAIKNKGWELILIWGPQGKGKSTLMLQLLYYIYGDWDKVLDHVVFKFNEFDDVVDADVEKYGRCRGLGWDDLGVHFNKSTKRWDKDVLEFLDEFDAIRPRLAVMIGTLVQLDEPVAGLRKIATCEVCVPYLGFATFHKLFWRTHFKRAGENFVTKRMEACPVWQPVPPEIFERYEKQRKFMVDEKHAARKELVIQLKAIKKAYKQLDPLDQKLLLGIYDRFMQGPSHYSTIEDCQHVLEMQRELRGPDEILSQLVRLSALNAVTYRMGKVRLQHFGRRLAEHIIEAEGLKLRPISHAP